MNSELYFLLMIIVAGAVTILLRALPFIAGSIAKKPSPLVKYIGNVLSAGAISMLVIFCFCSTYKDKSFSASWGIPEAAATLVVVALQLWKRNPLLSIIAGTAVYMVLVQAVFNG